MEDEEWLTHEEEGMKVCPNCGHDELYVTTDKEGQVWFHCLNKRCHES
jgi:hypothetical protein